MNSIPREIRDELNQTPAWWDREYRRLHDATFEGVPFNPDDHDGHNVIEIGAYTATGPQVHCTECPTKYTPRRKET